MSDELRDGAASIAYRCEQLAGVARVARSGLPPMPNDELRITLVNALIESTLVNARSLAGFLKSAGVAPCEIPPPPLRPKQDSDHEPDLVVRHFTDDPAAVSDDLKALAAYAHGVISRHLGHITVHRGEITHPDRWPIYELAAVLVGGVRTMVAHIADDERREWFVPQPSDQTRSGSCLDFLVWQLDFEPSTHPQVGELARRLQRYLAG